MPGNTKIITSLPSLPPRSQDGHKGTFGRVLVVGGSDGMIGAPVLAGTAALRMGAGLVQLAVPRDILHSALSITPELIGLGLAGAGSSRSLLAAAELADAIVLGPGMGRGREAVQIVARLVRLEKPMVIDADALNILAAAKRWPKHFQARAVLTPHPGEMGRLAHLFGRDEVPSDEPGRIDLAATAARTLGQVVVLKGHRTVVSDGQRIYVNPSGDSTLAKAGSGDVLSGMLGCLLAQRVAPFDAACLATFLHGRAGELAGRALGPRSALARDIIAQIGPAITQL